MFMTWGPVWTPLYCATLLLIQCGRLQIKLDDDASVKMSKIHFHLGLKPKRKPISSEFSWDKIFYIFLMDLECANCLSRLFVIVSKIIRIRELNVGPPCQFFHVFCFYSHTKLHCKQSDWSYAWQASYVHFELILLSIWVQSVHILWIFERLNLEYMVGYCWLSIAS